MKTTKLIFSKIKFNNLILTTIFSLIILNNTSIAQNADEILKKVDEVMYSFKDLSGKQKIILIDKTGKEEVRETIVKQKGSSMRMMRFTSPASQAGVAFLSLPNDVIYLYMPAYGKEKRIASSAKQQNFAGTDFSYDDLEAKPFTEKFTPKLLKTNNDNYTLELIPKTSSNYSKLIITINKTTYCPVTTEFYDKGNNKVKISKYTFKKIGKYWNPEVIEMTDLKKNHKTKMQMSEVKYDVGLKDDEFTVRKLKE
ncbi:MAG TPA: outer membrane lipoprotein-sorting protein [Bacteroidales bacterium]|nr:outer membrane lipoprotein-sorting protein [Bacteroidales bacterium]